MSNTNEFVLQMQNINKTFPGVKALNGACLDLRYGEVLALCGGKRRGKSTLMKCLSGVYKPDPDSGEILYQGKPIHYTNPNEAKKDGIVLIFQELSLVMDLSVAENIYLGSLPMTHGRVNWKKLYSDTQEVLDKLGCPASPKAPVSTLPIAQQQMIEIARGIALGAKILILDEPTSSLTEREKNYLSTSSASSRVKASASFTSAIRWMRSSRSATACLFSATASRLASLSQRKLRWTISCRP